jgi:rhamnosyltransferase
MTRKGPGGTCAVLVTFRPAIERLERVLHALRDVVREIVVVDNGSPHVDWSVLTSANPTLRLHKLDTNVGIAAAQNEGIAIARRSDASYVLFLDQDSIPHPGMVARLHDTLIRLCRDGHKVAGVGPRSKVIGGEILSRFERLGWVLRRSAPCAEGATVVECDYLISSGTLVPLSVFDEVGDMDADLFIDAVDIEWCLRARARGYRIYGDCAAFIDHRLGDSTGYRFWLGRWRTLRRHTPVRYYYMFRNSIALFRRSYVPMKWISSEALRLLVFFFAFGVLGGVRSGALRMMLKGIVDGLRGSSGKLEVQRQ